MPATVEQWRQFENDSTSSSTPGTITNATGSAYVLPFTEQWVVASTIILAIFFLFGFSANTVTIAVIRTSRRLRNNYYAFISSMCVSDALSAFTSILFLYRRAWGFLYFAWPEFFCRFYWGLDLWTNFATALHILSFAILRLIGVSRPTLFRQISSRKLAVWISSIWFVTFTAGFIPHFLFNHVKAEERVLDPSTARWASCSLDPRWISTWQIYVQIVYALFIFFPALGIMIISTAITVILSRRKVPGDRRPTRANTDSSHPKAVSHSMDSDAPSGVTSEQSGNRHQDITKNKKRPKSVAERARSSKDRQAILQLWLIVGSFLFGYIPLTAYHYFTGFTINVSNNHMNAFDWRFAMVQYMMLRFSECLNPVFYNLSSMKMRTETKRFLSRLLPKKQPKTRLPKNIQTVQRTKASEMQSPHRLATKVTEAA